MVYNAGMRKTKATHNTEEILDENTNKKVREAKRDDKLTEELMYGKKAYKRTVRDTAEERDKRYARLHSFGGKSNVEMFWDLGPDAIRDQVFRIRVGTQEAVISATELQKYLRWV